MLKLFYFSGTGNARNVARWMVETWQERGRQAEAIDLAKEGSDDVQVGPDDEIGFASPTHGFNFPPITLAFLFAFPRTTYGNRVFIINTRAGVRLFKVCFPGLSGVAQLLGAVVFLLKGYRVVGMRPIDLPSNWISLHPGLREENIRAIYERCEAVTRRCAQRLLDGQSDLRALYDLLQDLLIAPIAIGYYLVGRFFFAKSFIASATCDACGVCIKQCPVKAVRLMEGRPFWSHRCESCMRCINQCPKRAIETAHGFVAGFLFFFNLIMLALIYPALHPVAPVLSGAGFIAKLARFVFETILMLSALFLSYRVLHRALRFRAIEQLTVLTSLTHFGFWRRYRVPNVPIASTVRREPGDEWM